MAIARRTNIQSGNSGTSTGTAINTVVPTDTGNGDVTVVVLNMIDNALSTAPSISSPPAGWTAVGTGGVVGYLKLIVYWKATSATDAGTTVTFTADRTSVYEWSSVSYSGVDTTTPFSASTYTATPNSTLTNVTDAITPGSVNDWIMAAFGDRTTTSSRKTTNWTPTSPNAELAEINNNSKASAPWSSHERCDDGTTIGSTSSVTRTSVRTGPTADTTWQSFIGSLNPASSGSTFNDSGSGTITLSGATTEAWSFSSSGAGTITLGGSSSQSLAASDSRSGTLTLGGTGTQSFAHSGSASGTVTLGGTAVEQWSISYNDSGAGTISLAGSSTQSLVATDSRAGSLTLGGTKSESEAHTASGSGTVTLSGTAVEQFGRIFNDSGSGTITLASGATSQSAAHTGSGSGAVVLSGTATESNSGSGTVTGSHSHSFHPHRHRDGDDNT